MTAEARALTVDQAALNQLNSDKPAVVIELPDNPHEQYLSEAGLVIGPSYEQAPATPEPTPPTSEDDPFASYDLENSQIISEKIEARTSSILEEREWANEPFELNNARLAAVVKLNIGFSPDISFGVLTNTDGTPYALVYNHNMDCVRAPLSENDSLGLTHIEPGSAGRFQPGIREIQVTPIDDGLRLETVSVERFLDEVNLQIDGNGLSVPALVIHSFSIGGEEFDCPTIQERAGDTLGSALDRVQELAGDVDLGEIIESAGEALGRALSRFGAGFERGRQGN